MSRDPVVACTIVAKNYLAQARVLARSLATYNPGSKLYVLLADEIEGRFDPRLEPFHLITVDALGLGSATRQMRFYYSLYELCCGLRAPLHQYMVDALRLRKWLFLDPDILVTSSLDPVWKELDRCSILLSPHANHVVPPSRRPFEKGLLDGGVFNGGFLGLQADSEGRTFIQWLRDRTEHGAFADSERGLFMEQLWLNLVPTTFPRARISRHPGLNVACWNFTERAVGQSPMSQFRADGEPLLFVHFAGWRPEQPDRVTHHYGGLDQVASSPVWKELVRRYRAALFEAGWEEVHRWPYAFGRFPSGRRVHFLMRRGYHASLFRNANAPADPFRHEARMWALWIRALPSELARRLYHFTRRWSSPIGQLSAPASVREDSSTQRRSESADPSRIRS